MNYKDELENATNDNQQTDDYSIKEDIKQIFNDDTLFGEMMTQVVGEAVGQIGEKTIETLQEKFNDLLQSDSFSGRLADQLEEKTVERPEVDTSLPERENETSRG